MRKILFVLTLLAAAPAFAQDICVGSLCYTPTVKETQAAKNARDDFNRNLCESVSLAAGCTQGDYAAAGGQGTLYSYTLAGVGELFLDRIKGLLASALDHDTAIQREAARTAWQAADDATRSTVCTALGLTAQCRPQ